MLFSFENNKTIPLPTLPLLLRGVSHIKSKRTAERSVKKFKLQKAISNMCVVYVEKKYMKKERKKNKKL